MKFALGACALLAASVALAAPGPRQPAPRPPAPAAQRVSVTPEGYFVRGNPAAKLHLIEYGSFTCPHCAAFAAESKAGLNALIASGRLSLEYRPALRDQLDLAAAIVARCTGPARYFQATETIFAEQPRWFDKGAAFINAEGPKLTGPIGARLRKVADAAGLSAIGARYGVAPAKLAACFADARANQKLVANAEAAFKRINGTPTFFLGDEKLDAGDWARLEPLLTAKLKG